MSTFWVGTSGYSYSEWKGSFYPEDLPENAFLRYYGQHFSSVEMNYTFYRMATVRLLQGWGRETPESFLFSFKAPRRITHDLRLRDAADLVSDFCDTAATLKEKLGALLFQLPPFLKRDLPRLEDFLHQMPPGFRVTFEFRNQSWFTDEVYDCLRRFGVAICIVDAPDRETPWEATAEFGYFRLRQPDYTDESLGTCAEKIQEIAARWQETFIYFKHEEQGKGPMFARRMQDLLATGRSSAAAQAG